MEAVIQTLWDLGTSETVPPRMCNPIASLRVQNILSQQVVTPVSHRCESEETHMQTDRQTETKTKTVAASAFEERLRTHKFYPWEEEDV